MGFQYNSQIYKYQKAYNILKVNKSSKPKAKSRILKRNVVPEGSDISTEDREFLKSLGLQLKI